MKKVKFKHVLFSLILGVAASALLSIPILQTLHRQALLTTQEDVEKIYQELNSALIQMDVVRLQKLLADGFELETSRGATLSKQEWIRSIQYGTMRYNQFSHNEVQALGRNSAAVSSIVMGEIWNNRDTWKIVFHLEIIRKGQNVQIQRMVASSVCEMGVNGLFEQNCQGKRRSK
ncbi:nuclear transport factor 2 family protein [Bibersteinia trehalosi]|uniref:Nuclear transport factor 2 family protein n=1 Tax=Bibersteinia trehalosi TaxID=47735 RepID=A0A426FKV4_BIBTR|nr:nuclear transport factor 2 family protein [Bibersteinia trehalosi]RRN06267.1 nuclear transport factor 2 family protein [Bibersteinia trehalosi]